MFGIICVEKLELISRHRTIGGARKKLKKLRGRGIVCRSIKLRAIGTSRGMIGHHWPLIGKKITKRDLLFAAYENDIL